MAGWLGDATIKNKSGNVEFKNDDYVADLVADNISNIMQSKGISMDKAT